MIKCPQRSKGQLSLEFIISLLIILIVLSFFIVVNLKIKNTLEEKANYKNYNQEVCTLNTSYAEDKIVNFKQEGGACNEVTKIKSADNGT